MTNKPGRINQMTDKFRDELIFGWTRSGDNGTRHNSADSVSTSDFVCTSHTRGYLI